MRHRQTWHRLFSVLLLLILALGGAPGLVLPASALSFSDVAPEHWAYEDISLLTDTGIINGMGDGTYAPEETLTRGQYIKLVTSVMGCAAQNDGFTVTDVPAEHWVYPYMTEAFSRGILLQSDLSAGAFRPDEPVDRQTAALWMIRALGMVYENVQPAFTDVAADSSELARALATSQRLGLIQGYPDGSFRPASTLTRAEAAAIIRRMQDQDQEMDANREAANTIRYQPGVLVTGSGEKNTIHTNGAALCILNNIDETVAALRPGDVLVLEHSEALPGGFAVKVQRISVSGTQATIYKAPLEPEDIFADMDLHLTGFAGEDSFVRAQLGEGVALKTYGADGYVVLAIETPMPIGDHAKVFGQISLKLGGIVDAVWSDDPEGSRRIGLNLELSALNEFFLTGQLEQEVTLPLATGVAFPVSGGGIGAVVWADLFVHFNADGEIKMSALRRDDISVGAGYDQGDLTSRFQGRTRTEWIIWNTDIDRHFPRKAGDADLEMETAFQGGASLLGGLMEMETAASAKGDYTGRYRWIDLADECLVTEENARNSEDMELIGDNTIRYHDCSYCVAGEFSSLLDAQTSLTVAGRTETVRRGPLNLAEAAYHTSPESDFGPGPCGNYTTVSLDDSVQNGRHVVYADTVEELRAAIASDTEIRLGNKVYDLGESTLILEDVHNLAIVGDPAGGSTILQTAGESYRTTNIIAIYGCEDIVLADLSVGRSPTCPGSIRSVIDASNFYTSLDYNTLLIRDCELFGAGCALSGGPYVITVADSTIRDCLLFIAGNDVGSCSFQNCTFLRNGGTDGDTLVPGMGGNDHALRGREGSFHFLDCYFQENKNPLFADPSMNLEYDLTDCTFQNNAFGTPA